MMYCHWSFLNWSRLVPEIEAQLYAKYGITKPEQKFIESMVKPIQEATGSDLVATVDYHSSGSL